jgi:hypothetical protein
MILFSLGGNGLMMVGSSSTVMVRIKAQLTFPDVVAFFVIAIAMTFPYDDPQLPEHETKT